LSDVVGSASIRISADTTGFRAALKSHFALVNKDAKDAGTVAGLKWSTAFNRAARTGLESPDFDSIINRAEIAGERAGKRFSKAYQDQMRAVARDTRTTLDEVSTDLSDTSISAAKRMGTEMAKAGRQAADSIKRDVESIADAAQVLVAGTARLDTRPFDRSAQGIQSSATGIRRTLQNLNYVQPFSSMEVSARSAADAMTQLIIKSTLTGVALFQAGGGIASLVTSFGVLVAGAAQAAQAVLALPAAFSVLGQMGGTLAVALRGVGSALSKGFAATRTQKALKQNAKQVADLTSQYRGIADARRRLSEVQVRAAERAADAEQRVGDVQARVAGATDRLIMAQSRLNAARTDALEELQQLGFATEDAVLGEKRAGIALEEAFDRLNKMQNLPPDNRTRREAELAYAEAELNFRQAKDRAADMAKEQEKAAAKGVEGTRAYTDAQNEVARAQQDLADAQQDKIDAQQNLARIQRDNANDVAVAQQNLARAYQDLARAQRGSSTATSKAATAVDQYRQALASLSPSARDFVTRLVEMKKRFNEFKKAIQEPFFAEFNKEFFPFIDRILPILERSLKRTSKILGVMAGQFLKTFSTFKTANSSAEGLTAFESILLQINGILGVFTKKNKDGESAITGMTKTVLLLTEAGLPLIRMFADLMATFFQKKGKKQGTAEEFTRVSSTLNSAGVRIKQFKDLFVAMWRPIRAAIQAAGPAITTLLGYLTDAFNNLGKDAEDNNFNLTQFFKDVVANAKEILPLFGNILKAFFKLGANKTIGKSFKILNDGLFGKKNGEPSIVDRMIDSVSDAGPLLAKLIVNVAGIGAAFADSTSIKIFVDILSKFVGFVRDIVESPIAVAIFKVVAPILAVARGVGLIVKAFGLLKRILIGNALKGLLDAPKAVAKSAGTVVGTTQKTARRARAAKSFLTPGPLFDFSNSFDDPNATPTTKQQLEANRKVDRNLRRQRRAIRRERRSYMPGLAAYDDADRRLESVNARLADNRSKRKEIKERVNIDKSAARKEAYDAGFLTTRGYRAGLSAAGGAEAVGLEFVREFKDAVRRALEIRSPSQWMARIGNDTAAGFLNAIRAKNAAFRSAGVQAASAFEDGMASQKAGIAAQGDALAASASAAAPATSTTVGGTRRQRRREARAATPKRRGLVGKGALGAVAGVAGGALASAMPGELGNAISNAASFAGMGAAFGPWGAAIGAIVGLIVAFMPKIIQFFKDLYARSATFRKIVDGIKTAFSAVMSWLSANWKTLLTIITTPFRLAWAIISTLFSAWKAIIGGIVKFVATKFTAIKDAVLNAFAQFKQDPFGFIKTSARRVLSFITGLFSLNSSKKGSIAYYIARFVGGVGSIGGKIWDWLKDSSIGSFVVTTVNSVIDLLNSLPFINIPKIGGAGKVSENDTRDKNARPSRIFGFADGGYVSGPGGPRDDRIHARLSNGEYVLPADIVRVIGRANLDKLRSNSGSSSSILSTLASMPGASWKWVTGKLRKGVSNWITPVEAVLKHFIKKIPGDNDISKFLRDGLTWGIGGVASWVRGLLGETPIATTPGAVTDRPTRVVGGIHFPVDTYTGLSRRFWGRYPGQYHNRGSRHTGLDFMAPTGTPIRSVSSGIVRYVLPMRGAYGNYVIVSHGSYDSLYAHMRGFNPFIRAGSKVNAGTLLGYVGSTGYSSGPHLHFEIRPRNRKTPYFANQAYLEDPLAFLRAAGIKLARGGVVNPSTGGTLAVIGEAGRRERVEPLDRQGLSARDRAIIAQLAGTSQGTMSVRVFIGETELTSMIRTEIRQNNAAVSHRALYSRIG
jgi:murein DD-endopeptidase MepM/ murein hydrolase activator NlpD